MWWIDFDHSTTYYPGAQIDNQWSHFAFEVYYGEMVSQFLAHPQLMMFMFSPDDWDGWLLENYPQYVDNLGIFVSSATQWLDPLHWTLDNPQISFPEMSYFGSGFIDLIAQKLKLFGHIEINIIFQYLYSLEWYNSS